ncbi:MAG: 50S ribosomal protein L11 methyltransferase [bacterium]
MRDPDTLLQLTLTVPMALADDVAGRLAELCPEGFEEREAPGEAVTRYVVYGVDGKEEALRLQIDALARELGRGPGGALVTVESDSLANENWREAWKVHFQLQHVDRFVIQPSWLTYEPRPGEHVIHLDPGSAFGTGLHESTRLCLRALAALQAEGFTPARVLDFGCGTGILALGATLLWTGCEVVAVDNDPLAVRACEENVARNGQGARIAAAEALPAAPPWALTVANVSRPVLVGLASTLARATAPDGRLVLSGLLEGDREAVEAAYAAAGAETLRVEQEGEWLVMVLRRSP